MSYTVVGTVPPKKSTHMPLLIKSRHTMMASLHKHFPGAEIIDVTSKGPSPWVRFSPFFAHGNIPVPFSPGTFGASVEGIWQGLKVFEQEGVDLEKLTITNMQRIKRGGPRRGRVRGHQRGLMSQELLSYQEARYQIYLPTYRWVLETLLQDEVSQLRSLSAQRQVILLDYETNGNIDDLSKPLSHASLINQWIIENEETCPSGTLSIL
jgi:hypothetical protein